MTFYTRKITNPVSPNADWKSSDSSSQAWNHTRTEYPRDKTVAELFEEIAAANLESIALESGALQITYSELNERANRLAHKLQRMGVGAETMVGCCLERSPEMIVALLAILKAGGAYVPLDPSYPKERFDFLMRDAHMPLALTQRAVELVNPRGSDLALVFLDENDEKASSTDSANIKTAGGPRSLAYVMYTSGSTGRPKGVLVENRSIVRLVRNTNYCRFGPDEVFLQLAPISFDASTFEIWGALLNGGRLVLMAPGAVSLEEIGRTIRERKVTTLWLTAGLFHLMVDERLEDLRPIRQLLAGGDVLSPRHVRAVLEAFPDCSVINGYGPTENTTFTCCHTMRTGERLLISVPIGRPISNTQIYILDESLNPVPYGQTGELYAAGDGLARGYHNNPEGTREKFLVNPFDAVANATMYRTGDLARIREDGVVEFVGRDDSQVKILGHRVELGEVEAVLGEYEGIKQVCVIADDNRDGSKHLLAYYVPSSRNGVPVGITTQHLRTFVRGKLPQYMIPARFISLDRLPLSPNGKVDRFALPPLRETVERNSRVSTAATKTEEIIAGLWQRILRAPHVGLEDNFFDLGGDSLLLVAVHSNLQKTLKIEIQITDLFEFTTVRSLAHHLDGHGNPEALSEVSSQAQRQRAAFVSQRDRHKDGAL